MTTMPLAIEEIENEMEIEVSKCKKDCKKNLPKEYVKINALRKADSDFDRLVSEIDKKIENFISGIDSSKSFNPVPASSTLLKIFVTAIPFTAEEKKCLLSYLEKKYHNSNSNLVGGDYFDIDKCWFSNRYCIKTRYYHYDF